MRPHPMIQKKSRHKTQQNAAPGGKRCGSTVLLCCAVLFVTINYNEFSIYMKREIEAESPKKIAAEIGGDFVKTEAKLPSPFPSSSSTQTSGIQSKAVPPSSSISSSSSHTAPYPVASALPSTRDNMLWSDFARDKLSDFYTSPSYSNQSGGDYIHGKFHSFLSPV
jgi:hypothetical protein